MRPLAGDLTIHDVAPRLSRAWRDHRAAEKAKADAAWRQEQRRRSVQLQLERLVAHRELQLLRAHRGGQRYFSERVAKLEAAQRALDRVRRRAA